MKQLFTITCFILPLGITAQNVGIGTNLPKEKLHVEGNIKADTIKPGAIKLAPNAADGKILTSDESGNASWKDAANPVGGVGFGAWGDCTVTGVSAYQPASDSTQTGDYFGNSVSISGNYAIVGSSRDDIGTNMNQGSASIYHFNGNNWVLLQKIVDATGEANALFGFSVSISDNYAIVGSLNDDEGVNIDNGSVSIYQNNGSSWSFMQKITDVNMEDSARFGSNVSISGNYAIVGSSQDDVGTNINQGSASIYQFNGSNWVLMQKITDADGAADDNFGWGVSISDNYAIVGIRNDDVDANTNQGSASIYYYNGSTWEFINKVTDTEGAMDDNFGNSVSISGNYAIVGSTNDDVGANLNQGSACIFRNNGSSWSLVQKLTNTGGEADDYFGSSVSVSGNYAIVGSSNDDVAANIDQGSCIIFIKVGNLWQRLQYLTDPLGSANDNFGYDAISIDGITHRFAVGARKFANSTGKVVFGKVN